MKKVEKRNGQTVAFLTSKIVKAIKLAMVSSDQESPEAAQQIAKEIKAETNDLTSIYEIEKMVENKLMNYGLYDTARQYIGYRHMRAEERARDTELMQRVRDIITLKNIENENANMNEYVFTAKLTRIANETSAKYARNNLLRESVLEAFDNNDIYIHDFNSYSTGMHNCMFVDLHDILTRGFETTNGTVRTPKTIRAAMQLVAVIFQCQSNQQFGGIASNKFDYDLAPFVAMSFSKHFKEAFKWGIEEGAIEAINKDIIRLENEELQSNYPKAYKYALDMTEEETFQSAEALIHNLNTLESRAGNQLPFTSINYGTDVSPEGRLIMKSMLHARIQGVGVDQTTPIFPISVFKIKKGVNDVAGTPNYDLKLLAIESATKRIYPNFVNCDAEAFEPQTPDEEPATMGCRTRLSSNRHGSNGKSGRGNISPVTINLTKLGIDYGVALGDRKEADLEGFWEGLDNVLDITVQALLDRYEWQAKQFAKSAPFMYRNKVWKGRELNDDETVGEILKSGSLAIGFLGLSNMLVAMFGKHHAQDQKVWDFGYKVVNHIYKFAQEASEEHDMNFGCYATPAESLCHKQLKLTRNQYGIIKGVTDRDYLNNSFHVPVYHDISIKEKIDTEAPFHKICTGGSITYVELDGNARNNTKAVEKIVDYAMSQGIYYFALNHPIDSCSNCGYEGIIGEECPKCGSKDGDVYIKRLRRVTGYITGDYNKYFNDGKHSEVNDRVKHS
ncbi:anaerobic ribonucleoside triphosphate reductase [Sediminitomix flava]|uniref:Ribonucleoside-triphosphate reductase class III catalytic subunit n=1 Tax=Sediminitomix flava TaxID=379075 RepID=A0A315Z9R3_SEDFL|nr:anaerobic ribonucleoside triphosphate reductase [Sediminitomix flava]PWJ42315.1 ribonucleoside-triphosphate reductase class III catalytic subunit [Sediminitomix flava]